MSQDWDSPILWPLKRKFPLNCLPVKRSNAGQRVLEKQRVSFQVFWVANSVAACRQSPFLHFVLSVTTVWTSTHPSCSSVHLSPAQQLSFILIHTCIQYDSYACNTSSFSLALCSVLGIPPVAFYVWQHHSSGEYPGRFLWDALLVHL